MVRPWPEQQGQEDWRFGDIVAVIEGGRESIEGRTPLSVFIFYLSYFISLL
jgi:hypothetical protein